MSDLTMSRSSLPVPFGVTFWRTEIDRAQQHVQKVHPEWDANVLWYEGKSPDADKMGKDYVNVNVDFYQVEQKLAQLFYETPDLRAVGTGLLKGQSAIVQAHRAAMNTVLGSDHMNVLAPVHRAIKDCLCVSGTGPVVLGYEPYQRPVENPQIPGAILNLNATVPVTLHDKWYADHDSPKKFLAPADFTDTDWDKAPWLGMRFSWPLTPKVRTSLNLPQEFMGTASKDQHILNPDGTVGDGDLPRVEGVVIWYRAAFYEDVHPELYRELVLVEGLEQEARHRDSPHQTILPNGAMTGDSLIGNPIHPLTIRTVPDKNCVPSDSQMTRPLVRELCQFRTQMVQQRDADRTRVLYDTDALPPEVITKIEAGTLGSMIGLEGGKLAAGVGNIMAEVVKGNPSRQTYLANDYITRDIEKTLAIDATGAGVSNDEEKESATKTATVERNRNVRLDHERRQVLQWYLGLVNKISALVLRYATPQRVATWIGPEAAQAWAQLQQLVKQGPDQRLTFTAKPDSQIRLDAAVERKFWLDIYQFVAKDPNVVRTRVLHKLFEVAGENPMDFVVDQIPDQKPDPSLGFSFKGEDLIGPQGAMVREILAQLGIQISQESIDESAGQMFKQLTLGIRDADGKAVPPTTRPKEHGGTAEKVRPLSQQSADKSGDRPGPKTEAA